MGRATVGLLALTSLSFGQTPSSPKFEVASVKIGNSGRGAMRGGPGTSSPERINYSGVTLMMLITRVYGVNRIQVSGPGWLSEERYEVMANVPPGTTTEGVNLMVQNLLAERFNLRLHHETKEVPMYQLIVVKGGLRLKESTAIRRLPNGQVASKIGTGPIDGGRQRLRATSTSMALLASVVQDELGIIVKDETGLTGYYDFEVEFVSGAGDASTPGPVPLLSSALEDLGLKLQKTTGPMDIVVVDSVVRQPTAN
jgi:uncharacterized protein (TIGR03435 family)